MGSPVLARPPALVVQMGERAGGGETRDRRRLASRRLPLVLALAFAPPFWPTENHSRASRSHRSMAAENPTWGAPRIHGELLKLGFEISESTVSRYLAQGTSSPDSTSAGSPFSRTIVRPSPPLIFLPCPPR